jgi:hypothetical protein
VSVPVLPIAHTAEQIGAALQAELDRLAAERRRRHVLSLSDWAVDLAERQNLAGGDRAAPVPSAAAMVEWLQLLAGEHVRRPSTNQDALDELFRLQERYLLSDDLAELAVTGTAR